DPRPRVTRVPARISGESISKATIAEGPPMGRPYDGAGGEFQQSVGCTVCQLRRVSVAPFDRPIQSDRSAWRMSTREARAAGIHDARIAAVTSRMAAPV